MFSSRGAFEDVPCPARHDCALPNCFFRHDYVPMESDEGSNQSQVYDPAFNLPAEQPDSPPPVKRRRLNTSELPIEQEIRVGQVVAPGDQVPDSRVTTTAPLSLHSDDQAPGSARLSPIANGSSRSAAETSPRLITPASVTVKANNPRLTAKKPASVTRPVSPPATSRTQKIVSSPGKPYRKPSNTPGSLHPRPIEQSPVKFDVRLSMLTKLHKQIDDANNRYRKEFSKEPSLILSKEELQTQALDDEERIANQNPSPDAYKIALGHRVAYFTKKMTPDVWRGFVTTTWLTDPNLSVIPTTTKIPPPKFASGLTNSAQETAVLKLLRTGLHQYAQYGYVIKAPPEQQVADAKRNHRDAGSFETCDRCATRFHVYPGRNAETGALTSKGSCTYHWARLPMARGAVRDGAVFPCCGQAPGTPGCETAPTHVFKMSDPARLAGLVPYKETPKHNDGKVRGPIVFDCEMSYTTCGLELVRVTALSWPDNTTRLDVLVRPIGEILDFNTRFSGVTAQMFTNARDYGHGRLPRYTPDEALQKVASPAAARDLLFDLIDPETPLLGHAIDNDLNACRIIHPFVIDTVLLYPHPRGLPIKFKLRDLAKMHLQRRIQTGELGADGVEGHDSKEDSAATGDLVLKKVGEKWDELRREGWWWLADKLMTPGSAKGAKKGVGS